MSSREKYKAHFDHHPEKDNKALLYFDENDAITITDRGISTFRGIRDKDGKKGVFPISYVGKIDPKTQDFECKSCKEFSMRVSKLTTKIEKMEIELASVADEIYISCLAKFRGVEKRHVEDENKFQQLKNTINHLKIQIDILR